MSVSWSNVFEVAELDSGADWSADDLRAMLRHQLSLELGSTDAPTDDGAPASPDQTLGDALAAESPSPEALARVESLISQRLGSGDDDALPLGVSTVLEALLHAARVRAGLTAATGDDPRMASVVRSAVDTPWLDPEIVALLSPLRERLTDDDVGSAGSNGDSAVAGPDEGPRGGGDRAADPGGDPAESDRRGRYVIERPHAAGGLGVLSLARDVDLDRVVALKEIRPELRKDTGSRQRFVREAQIAGELEHPNIVPVYALGRDESGNPYYAMRFIGGRTLEQAIAQHHRQPSREALRDLLRRFGDVCRAVAYAHSRGIVHRDLKPLNIMLGDFGETWVVDWGIAKRTSDAAPTPSPAALPSPPPMTPPQSPGARSGDMIQPSHTAAGQSLGTPRYMSPEQRADARLAGPLSDVYSLGAILRQIVTGQPPHPDKPSGTPRPGGVPLRRRGGAGVRALEAVAARAMSDEPAARYAGAAEVAAEVERWLADEPVEAYDEPLLNALGRWSRRHRAAVVAGVGLLLTSAVVLGVGNVRIRGERDAKARAVHDREAALSVADENMNAARRSERTAQERLAETLRLTGDSLMAQGRATDAADRYRDALALSRSLGLSEAGIFCGLLDSYIRSPRPLAGGRYATAPVVPSFPDFDVLLDPDGRTVIGGEADGTLVWRDIATGVEGARLKAHAGPVRCLTISSDGRTLLTGGHDGSIVVWDAREKREVRRIEAAHAKPVRRVLVSPMGDVILSAGDDRLVKVFELATGRERYSYPGRNGPEHVETLAFAPDGRTVISGCHNGTLVTWDIASGQVHSTVAAHEVCVNGMRFTDDGRTLVTRGGDGALRTWEHPGGAPKYRLASPDRAYGPFALSRSRERLVAAGPDGSLTTWHLCGTQIGLQSGPASSIAAIDLGADGHVALTADTTGNVNLWSLGYPEDLNKLRGHRAEVLSAAFSPDGRLVASAAWDGTVRVWDVATGRELRRFGDGRGSRYWSTTFGPNGDTVIAGDAAGMVTAWSLAGGEQRFRIAAHVGASPTQPLATTQPTDIVTSMALSPDGSTLATAGTDRTVKLWEPTTGAPVRTLGGHGDKSRWVTFTPDGRRLLSASYDTQAKVWDVASGAEIGRLSGHTRWVNSVAVSPDGKAAVTGGRDGLMIVWDLPSGRVIRSAPAHNDSVSAVTFSPDGRTIASGGEDKVVRLWDRSTGAEVHHFAHHSEPVKDVKFSPDGTRLLTASLDRTLIVLDLSRPATYEQFATDLPRARQALQSNPHEPTALATVGRWFAFRGSDAIAVALLEEAHAGGADVSPLMLARAYWRLGRMTQAQQYFRLAQERAEAPAAYLTLCAAAAGHASDSGSHEDAHTLP